MEQKILTADQKRFLVLFKADQELRGLFHLAGGTALAAFHLHHRYSDDLDFFTSASPFPQMLVERFVAQAKDELGAKQVEFQHLHDRRIFIFTKNDEPALKVEFTYYGFAPLDELEEHAGLLVETIKDIATNKIMALMDRTEPKDYIDLYFILQDNQLTSLELLALAKKKFGVTISSLTLGSAYGNIGKVSLMPKMVKPLTLPELKDFFEQESRRLGQNIF